MKKILALAIAIAGFGMTASAQTLLYQWAFTNLSDTATSSIPTFAITPGTGTMGLRNVNGDAITPGNIYFTNVNSGPPGGPGGALSIQGQNYASINAIATNSSLNLGTLYQFSISFWVQYGVSMGQNNNQLGREVQFGSLVTYDGGGKGTGNHNGVGTALNGASGNPSTGYDTSFQDALANGSSALNQTVAITNQIPGGFICDGQTWYFETVTYDSSLSSSNFQIWIAQTNAASQTGVSLTNFVISTAQYGGIAFTTNASVILAGCTGAGRDITDGQIADVRIYSGVLSYSNMLAIENFQPPVLQATANQAAYAAVQPVSGNTFISGTRTFSVTALGFPATFTYLWRSNGVPVVGGTNASLTLTNLPLSANGASFICSITNVVGGTNSTPAILAVLTSQYGSYAQAIYKNSPYAFWRINEPSNALPVTVFDYANGHDGVAMDPAGMAFLPGVSAPTYGGFPLNNMSIETISGHASRLNMAPLPTYTNSAMTICGWVYTPTTGNATTGDNGLIFNLPSDTQNGYGLVFGAGNEVDYQWGNGAATFGSGLIMPSAEWTFVALVVTTNLIQEDIDNAITVDTNATVYVGSISGGFNSVSYSTALTGDIFRNNNASLAPLALGRTTVSSSENGGFYATSTAQFNGVAIFYSALSPSTVTNLYLTGVLSLTETPDPNIPGNLLLTYPVGTLQSANVVTGPYTPVNGASSPWSITPTQPQQYYRLSYP